MSSTDPWCKLWWSFYSSRSHIGIGREALAAGPVIMLLAKQSPPTDGGVRWIVMPDGRPVTAADVAHPMQDTKRAAAIGIQRLVERGTLVRREDGAIGWPGFDRYQRAPSTPRMQKKRERDRHSDAASDRHSDAEVTDRGEREEEREVPKELPPDNPPSPQAAPASHVSQQNLGTDPPGSADPDSTGRKAASDERPSGPPVLELVPSGPPVDALTDAVLGLLRAAVRDVTGKPGGPRDTPSNRKLVRDATKREGATLDDWRHVISAQAESVRRKPEALPYLCLQTICRPANFGRLRDAPAPGPSRGPVDPSTQDHTKPAIF